MKIKQEPDDFQVEELTDVQPANAGPFALYQMEKTGWSTPDAIQALRRRWHIEMDRVSYGGLKDRHAHTIQYLTIHNGPRRPLTHHQVVLRYLGQVTEPYTAQAIRANRFRLTLRALEPEEAKAAGQVLEDVRDQGVPNYFDDQRFGSVASGGDFMARSLVLGRYEEALRLALTTFYEHDRGPQKKEKALLRASWGDWSKLKAALPRGHARSLVDYLVGHPTDFRGALVRLRADLRSLYVSAFQSYLWNRMLARWLEQHCQPEQLLAVRFRIGTLPMHCRLDADQRAMLADLQVPLPSSRAKLDPADPRLPLVTSVLAEEGLELRQLQVRHIREIFFSKGERPALCVPENLDFQADADERHPGKQKLLLAFDLPRGCYATLIVKRIQSLPTTHASAMSQVSEV